MTKLYVIRHGSRVDHEDRSWGKTAARPHDAPISEKGWDQARRTGHYLRDKGITAVYASPFIRTIQTATAICDALDLPIFVEGGLSEWLNPKWHDYTDGCLPLSDLMPDYPRLDWAYQPLVRPRYPETDEEIAMRRYCYTARQLHATAVANKSGNIALISHGFCVYSLAKELAKDTSNKKEQNCAINLFEKKLSGWKLTFSTTNHLKHTDKNVEFV